MRFSIPASFSLSSSRLLTFGRRDDVDDDDDDDKCRPMDESYRQPTGNTIAAEAKGATSSRRWMTIRPPRGATSDGRVVVVDVIHEEVGDRRAVLIMINSRFVFVEGGERCEERVQMK